MPKICAQNTLNSGPMRHTCAAPRLSCAIWRDEIHAPAHWIIDCMSDYKEAVAQFRAGSAVLADALRGITPEESAFVPAPGKWNIRQLARHVADTEIVVGMRMRQIVAEDQPTLIPFDQEKWAAHLDYDNDALDSLGRFQSLRDDTARLLSSLPAQTFDRVGVHPDRGSKPLLEWVQLFAKHVYTHADQIRGIREAWKSK